MRGEAEDSLQLEGAREHEQRLQVWAGAGHGLRSCFARPESSEEPLTPVPDRGTSWASTREGPLASADHLSPTPHLLTKKQILPPHSHE